MLPVFFEIGSFKVYSFGVMMLLAFLAGLWIVKIRADRYGFTFNQISDFGFWALIAGIFGARIVFILQELPYYQKNPGELWSLQFKGLTSFGGMLFGLAALIVWAKLKRESLPKLLDLVGPGFLIGHVIGRVGCLLNGCCFGVPCPIDLPWGIHVDGSRMLHHPAQIYDAVMNIGVLGLVLFLEGKNRKAGLIAALIIALHGLTRFIYEFWRAGSEAEVERGEASSTYWGSLPITQAQAMAAVLALAGAAMYVYFARRKERPSTPEHPVLPVKETQPA